MIRTRFRTALFIAAVAAALVHLLQPSPARAHPHVWVTAEATPETLDDKVTAIQLSWTFDPMLSAVLVQDFDRNADGRYDADEQAALTAELLKNMSDYGYFTHVQVDASFVELAGVDGMAAAIGDKVVTMTFRARLKEPVDPRKHRITLGVYDPEYYIAFDLPAGSLHLNAPPLDLCRPVAREDTLNPIYFGYVNPEVIDVVCPAR
ncbi:DUF1007 family protein [Tistrella mobilis]|uniref:DUF1007 family protein n=1 Tax=Tistrella mobilis TaxID=171437 RepID=UPI003556BC5D